MMSAAAALLTPRRLSLCHPHVSARRASCARPTLQTFACMTWQSHLSGSIASAVPSTTTVPVAPSVHEVWNTARLPVRRVTVTVDTTVDPTSATALKLTSWVRYSAPGWLQEAGRRKRE